MENKQILKGIKYIVKVGRNKIAVRIMDVQTTAGYWIAKNLNTGKTFFVKSIKSFDDYQNNDERIKAEKIIAEEEAYNESKTSETSKVAKVTKIPKVSKVPNDSKISKSSNGSKESNKSNIFGVSKCAFVKAMGQRGYKHFHAKKVLDALGISMPEASIKIQIYFGKNEKTWTKFGKPAELTPEQLKQIDEIVR